MSSRLLGMKFMQRAAASSPTSTPSTPSEPASKRQRIANGKSLTTPTPDMRAAQEAIAVEEVKRNEILERRAAEAGETKWTLSYTQTQPTTQIPIRVVTAGYAAIDSTAPGRAVKDDGGDEYALTRPTIQGRRSFGKFNRAVERLQNPDLSSSSEDDSDDDSNDESDSAEGDDSEDDLTGTKAMIAQSRKEAAEKARKQRKAAKKAEKAESLRLAAERRSKEVKLNSSGRISMGGGDTTNTSNMTCFKCGKQGHGKRDCPSLKGQTPKKRHRGD